MASDTNKFSEQIYKIVKDIPAGYVLTYGMLAVLVGRPQNARQVGKIMSNAPRDITSHRVVNHAGRTVPSWECQREYLENEGVSFKENGCVDLKKHLWKICGNDVEQ